MSIISQKIKKKANELGFQKVGIAKVESVIDNKYNLDKWISKGFHASMHWIENRKEERANIFNYFPDAVSLISVGMNYFSGTTQDDIKSKYKFSNYAWGEDYHIIIKKYLFEIVEYMKTIKSDFNYRVCVDTSPLMEKQWAMRSGIGWIGKHTNLITRDYGSWLFIGAILIDFEIEADEFYSDNLCGTCTACIDECPTDAIIEPYILDSNKCISYLTIEHRGDIPDNMKGKLDNSIYGCDICQEVCPWNIKFEKLTEDVNFHPRKDIKNKKSISDWDIDKDEFNSIFKKSAVKRTKHEGLKRNVKLVIEKDHQME